MLIDSKGLKLEFKTNFRILGSTKRHHYRYISCSRLENNPNY